MKKLNLKEIQQAELENLKFLDNLCKKENFTYYLAYGTLLGAVRHHGFIPWDDDTDIWMPRKDYEKFKKYCEKNADKLKPFKLCTRENTKNYPYGIARFANQDYKYVSTKSDEIQFNLGVFTDIYPLDNFGNEDPIPMKKVSKYIGKKNIWYSRYCSFGADNFIKSFLKKFLYLFLHVIHNHDYAEKIDNSIIKKIKNNTSDDDIYTGVLSWDNNFFFRYKKEGFQNKVLLKFEDYKFPIPQGYDQILKITYGDYMKFPPESERHPYHGYKIYKK